jgi:hypothetical protein
LAFITTPSNAVELAGLSCLNHRPYRGHCIGPTGIAAIPLCNCPLRVNRVAAVAAQNQDLSVVGPIATKLLQRSERSDVPIATDAPQQIASLFDHLVGAQ